MDNYNRAKNRDQLSGYIEATALVIEHFNHIKKEILSSNNCEGNSNNIVLRELDRCRDKLFFNIGFNECRVTAIRSQIKKKYAPDSTPYRLAKYYYDMICKWNGAFKEPNMAAWATEIDLMIRIDKKTPKMIKVMMDKVQADDRFWKKNCLSPGKLRQRWTEGKLSQFIDFQSETMDLLKNKIRRWLNTKDAWSDKMLLIKIFDETKVHIPTWKVFADTATLTDIKRVLKFLRNYK